MTEKTATGDIVIDTPEGIQFFQLLQVAHGLAIEICTSMKMSSRYSALQLAKHYGIVDQSSRSKKAALKATVALLKQASPGYEPKPGGSVQKALDYKK